MTKPEKYALICDEVVAYSTLMAILITTLQIIISTLNYLGYYLN